MTYSEGKQRRGGWVGKSFDNVTLSTSQSKLHYLEGLLHVMRQLGWAVLCPMIGQSTEQSRRRFSIGSQYVSRFVQVNVC